MVPIPGTTTFFLNVFFMLLQFMQPTQTITGSGTVTQANLCQQFGQSHSVSINGGNGRTVQHR